jgi:hypothetical protein
MNPRDLMLLETRHTNDERNFAMSRNKYRSNKINKESYSCAAGNDSYSKSGAGQS